MRISKLLKKCGALILALAMVFTSMVPTLAAVGDIIDIEKNKIGYLALGDSMSLGTGLEAPWEEAYYVLVAEALGMEDDYSIHADKLYRVEDIRYLIDDGYLGDGYTKAHSAWDKIRRSGEVKNFVKNAEVISVSVGTNNFSTYIIDQIMYYLENDGKVKYDYSFDQFVGKEVDEALQKVQESINGLLLGAADDTTDEMIEFINFVSEISTYAVLSYVQNFNGMVGAIYELNPDVELYILGVYNPAEGEVISINGLTADDYAEFPIGQFFGGLVEIANAYVQVLAPRAFDYTYVDPGSPELLIDQMGNTKLDDNQRIPDGLIMELINLSGDAAVNKVVDIFADYGIEKTEMEALGFLEELLEAKEEDRAEEFIKGELQNYVVSEVEDQFQKELLEYLGAQFADEDESAEVVSKEQIEQLLADLDNVAGDVVAQEQVAGDFVDSLFSDSTLQNQVAAKVIHGYIVEKYPEGLADYVTVENVEALLADLAQANCTCAEDTDHDATCERRVAANNWVLDLAADQIVAKVESIVGQGTYSKEQAIAMLVAMENSNDAETVAREYLIRDIFHDYMVQKITESYTENKLTISTFNTIDAFVTAIETAATIDAAKVIVRAEIRAAAADKAVVDDRVTEYFGDTLTATQVLNLFASMDNANDKQAALKTWLNELLYANGWEIFIEYPSIYNGFVACFNEAYVAYDQAATASEEAVAKYLESVDTAAEACAQFVTIKASTVDTVLNTYDEYCDENGKLDVGAYEDFDRLRADAVAKIVDGYAKYVDAMELAMESANTFNEYLDPVYNMLKELAELETINLNNLLNLASKVTSSNGSYIAQMVNNLLVNQTFADEDKTIAYLALRYYLADGMMIMPSATGHKYIANRLVAAINGKDMESTAGSAANSLIDLVVKGVKDIFHLAKEYLSLPNTGSGQVGTLINPNALVAIGDNVTSGTALNNGDKTYVQLIADALAMEYEDIADIDDDKINNLAINGMRVEELWAILSDNYSGDAYTKAKFNLDAIATEYRAAIASAELITIEVGINNLVTFPMTQALLAYNGEEVYEMDWTQYFAASKVNKVKKGLDLLNDVLLYLVDNADSRVVDPITGYSAYDECERALNTFSVALESYAYSLIGYVTYLDSSVEKIAEMNKDATIVLVGFYNPLEDTYVQVDVSGSIKDKEIDLSDNKINISAITEKLINQANRHLTNFVGDFAANETAANKDSRIVVVSINDTELCISDTTASKNLANLTTLTTQNALGHNVDIMVPEYLYETLATGGSALHPNATGHYYIANRILNALDFEIYADVIPNDDFKYYGESDPSEFTFVMDDASSLYDVVVNIQREPGETVGFYDITAEVLKNTGYYEVDCEVGQFEIKARPVTVYVKVQNGVIVEVTGHEYDDALGFNNDILASEGYDALNIDYVDGEMTYSNSNYKVEFVVDDATGTIKNRARSLLLEDEVYISAYYRIEGFSNIDIAENSGMLIWYSEVTEEQAIFGNQDYIDEGLEYSVEEDAWYGTSKGFCPVDYATEIYIRGYIKVGDNYIYTPIKEYSVQQYCEKMIANSGNTELKNTCIALLYFGSHAQLEHGVNTDDLAYANIVDTYGADWISNVWDESYITTAGDFTYDEANIPVSDLTRSVARSISTNSKINITYYFDINRDDVVKAELLVWSGVDEMLTLDNVSYTVDMTDAGVNGWRGQTKGYPAATYSDVTYACARFETSDGEVHYTVIKAYSPEIYANNKISNENSSANLKSLSKALVIYGEYAKVYFDSKN